MTILTIFENIYIFFYNFDNFWRFWQFCQFLKISDNFLTIMTILTIFENFWQSWQFLIIFDNFDSFWMFSEFLKVFVTWDMTLETLIIFLTIENNNMNNYIVTFEQRVMVTAFAILAMFWSEHSKNWLFYIHLNSINKIWRLEKLIEYFGKMKLWKKILQIFCFQNRHKFGNIWS